MEFLLTSGMDADVYEILTEIMAIVASVVSVVVPILGTTLSIILAVIGGIIYALWSFFKYLLKSIPLFIFSKKAGHKLCWFAFIPYLRTYLMMTIALREYNLFNLIKTKKRGVIAIIYICLSLFSSVILSLLSLIPGIGSIPLIIKYVLKVVKGILRWRMYYDILKTMGLTKAAMPVSIIGVFFSFVYYVTFLFNCGREPEYGKGNHPLRAKEFAF